jgi:L-alanine-DL-glutamate epimerase-like enolase superfamily enzyme
LIRITDCEIICIGKPPELLEGTEGEFLVTPLHIFSDYRKLLGERSVGIRGGPVYAVIVKITTNEGTYGLGSAGVGNGAAAYILQHHLKPMILGENPFDVEATWEKMFRSTLNYGRKGVVLEAISAVDIALWDIMGKTTGHPVYNLLGGKTREKIRVYGSRLYANRDLDALALQAQEFVKRGFTALKQRFGFGPRDGIHGMRSNLELIRTVRQAVGPDVELMADAYMGWDVPYAIRMIRMIEDAGIQLNWVEEPVIPDDIDGYAEVRRAVKTPISGGEHEFTRYGFRDLIAKRAVDILQPDVNRVGGITEARKIWAMAAAHNIPVIPHAGQMHNYHLVMSHLNSPLAEYLPPASQEGALDDDTLFFEIFTGDPLAVEGHVELPVQPGLGLELNEENVRAWRIPG